MGTKVTNTVSIPRQPITSTLSKLTRHDLNRRDLFGRTILHILILCNRSDLLKHLFKNPEIKQIINKIDYENGWNCLHYMIFYKRLSCYRVLLEWLKTISSNGEVLVMTNSILFELVRCKDRNRLTPLQLLDNDFKNLIWVPEFIYDDKINLIYRFKDIEKHNEALVHTSTGGNGLGGVSGNVNNDKIKVRNITQFYNWWDIKRCGSDIYMFGSNLNNNLGVGDSTDRSIPCKLSISNFKPPTPQQDLLHNPRFKMVKLSKNHSVILTQEGFVFTCGIGSRGRLGHGDLANSYRFKKIVSLSHVKDVSISNDHSAVLRDGEVYSWGLNNYGQLGILNPNSSKVIKGTKDFSDNFESTPQLVFNGDLKKTTGTFKGIEVSKVHSLVYTKHDIISWGLNLGQMGFLNSENSNKVDYKYGGTNYKGSIQDSPRKVTLRDEIKLVTTCEIVTCVVTTCNDIHIYSNGQHIKLPKIPIRGSLDRNFHKFQPIKTTKPANILKIVMKSPENIGLLLDSGDVMGFNGTDTKNIKYNYIWKSHDSDLRVTDVDISIDGSVILTTSTGLVFMKSNSTQNNKIRKNSMSENSLPIPIKNKFKRVDFVNKIVKVSTNENFTSFSFVRDDTDLIPLKISCNTFRKDMEYLSCISPINYYRKQQELFNPNLEESYISDYIYSNQLEEEENYNDSEEEEEEDEEFKALQLDPLFTNHTNKYSSTNKRVRTRDTFQQLNIEEYKLLIGEDYLCSSDEKLYDSEISFPKLDTKIPYHKKIFDVRSPAFKNLEPDEYLEFEGIIGKKTERGIELSNVEVRSAIIFIHFIYTNKIISIWEEEDAKPIKEDFEKLCKAFKMSDIFGTVTKDEVYFIQMRSLYPEVSQEDKEFVTEYDAQQDVETVDDTIIVKLINGEVPCMKSILLSRSAFFETTLSQRWNTSTLYFNLTTLEFSIILRHLYGFSDFRIFEPLIKESENIDDLINSILDLISIADELLLFQLKNLCELLLKDLVNIDNAIILLIHADNLNANKLFLNCCWYIYNNLEVLLLDQIMLSIPLDIWIKLETNIRFLDNCKNKNFTNFNNIGNGNIYNDDWLIKKSIMLVSDFLYNLEDFNSNFMTIGRTSFEPVIDVKLDLAISNNKDKRRKSRKSSTNDHPDVQELRSRAKNLINESAIEDASDDSIAINLQSSTNGINELTTSSRNNSVDNFEVVTRRRRKVEFEKKSPSPPPVIIPTTTKVRRSSSATSSANSSFNATIDNSTFPLLGKGKSKSPPAPQSSSTSTSSSSKPVPSSQITPSISNVPVNNGLSPHSNWASKTKAAPIFDVKPTVSSSPLSTNFARLEELDSKKKKLGPNFKLSQRERKKLIINDGFQWGVPSSGISAINNLAIDGTGPVANMKHTPQFNTEKEVKFPMLGKKKSPPPPVADKKKISNRSSSITKQTTDTSQIVQIPPTAQIPITTTSSSSSTNSSASMLNNSNSGSPSGLGLTLTDIMIQESLKIEQLKQKENQRKTFQEIQQEQEFAKWWAEEEKRVQSQMNNLQIKKTNKKKNRKS